MITEFALTPQVFTNEVPVDVQKKSIEHLATALGHPSLSAALCVAGLDAVEGYCGWDYVAVSCIAKIHDQSTRIAAQKLYEKIEKALVMRERSSPGTGGLESEDDWIEEIHALEVDDAGIECVIHSSASKYPGQLKPSVWEGIAEQSPLHACRSVRTIQGDFVDQINVLKPVVRHSQFIELVVPRVSELYEGAVEEILSLCVGTQSFNGNSRQCGIHTMVEDAAGTQNVLEYARSKLSDVKGSCQVAVHVWQPGGLGIERRLIAGRVSMSGSTERKGARWGVHFSHLPWKGEGTGRDTFRTWSLIDAREAQRSLEFLCGTATESKRTTIRF